MFFEKLFQSVQVFHPTIPDDLFSRSPWQKAAQIDIEEHQRLMDASCLWLYIKPKLKDAISTEYMDKVEEMWLNGYFGSTQTKIPIQGDLDFRNLMDNPVKLINGGNSSYQCTG